MANYNKYLGMLVLSLLFGSAQASETQPQAVEPIDRDTRLISECFQFPANSERIQQLLDEGEAVNAVGRHGQTALIALAVAASDHRGQAIQATINAASLLLDNGANRYVVDGNNNTFDSLFPAYESLFPEYESDQD